MFGASSNAMFLITSELIYSSRYSFFASRMGRKGEEELSIQIAGIFWHGVFWRVIVWYISRVFKAGHFQIHFPTHPIPFQDCWVFIWASRSFLSTKLVAIWWVTIGMTSASALAGKNRFSFHSLTRRVIRRLEDWADALTAQSTAVYDERAQPPYSEGWWCLSVQNLIELSLHSFEWLLIAGFCRAKN